MNRVELLKDEIAVLKTKLRPQATGHIHTAISVLEDRIKELESVNKQDIELSKAKCRMEMDSPYNDGYTREFYRKELDRLNTLYEST
jgi:hypothetical protein